jgi:hypothetical protein
MRRVGLNQEHLQQECSECRKLQNAYPGGRTLYVEVRGVGAPFRGTFLSGNVLGGQCCMTQHELLTFRVSVVYFLLIEKFHPRLHQK